jgi:ATP/maltotriose-dependent transcriptional regulator MalT
VGEQFLGRSDELQCLEIALTALSDGAGTIVALVGEPGIGKSMLIAEALAMATARRYLVFSGRAAEFERDLPFGILVDALDPYLASVHPQRLQPLGPEERTQLARVFPALEAPPGPRVRYERFAAYQAVHALLALLARQRPVVLALDDLHWADQASIELIGYLLRRPPESALMVLSTRAAQVPARLDVQLRGAQALGDCRRLELGPLSRAEAEPLLAPVTDVALRDALYEEAGGNPFYLEQLARSPARVDPAEANPDAGGVPGVVRDALHAELAGVPPAVRTVLDAAAVAGDPFAADLVADVADLPGAEVLARIDEAIASGLVRPTTVPGYFAFRHPIVRRTVHQLSPPAWRVGAHARAAQALHARGASTAACAHHVERSATVGDTAAIALLTRAGRESAGLAPASAARWFAAALRLLPDGAPLPERVALLLPLATMLAAAGRLEESAAALGELLALLPDEQSVLRARVVTAMAVVERLVGRTGGQRATLAAALQELPPARIAEAAALSIELAADRYFEADWPAMGDPARRGYELAVASGDVTLRAAAAAVCSLAEINRGRGQAALALATEASNVLGGVSDDELALHLGAAHWVGWSLHHLERYDDVIRHYERALTVARARGQSHLLVPTLIGLAISYAWRGQLERASEQIDTAVELVHLVGAEPMIALTYGLRCWLAVRAGGLHAAMRSAELPVAGGAGSQSALHGPLAQAWLGEARIEVGAPAVGRSELLEAVGGAALLRIEPCQRSYYYGVLTHAEVLLGDLGAAAGWAQRAAAAAEPLDLAGPRVWALRSAAVVAVAGGEHERGIELAGQSVQAAKEVHLLERERSRLTLGRALAGAGRADEAVGSLERARNAFLGFGAAHLAEVTARELRRLGRRIPRAGRRGRAGIGLESLSARELEVARLVTDRLTNREIAAQLVLSEKTVERHLAHIFQKLGVDSRVAVAHTVEREGPPD